MNTLNFLDANVWLALLWDRHGHAGRAREWFRGCDDEQFLFCRFTQITVLRLLLCYRPELSEQISARPAGVLVDRLLPEH